MPDQTEKTSNQDDQRWEEILSSPEGRAVLRELADDADHDFQAGDFEED